MPMPWEWLSRYRRNRKEASRAMFALEQAVVAEEHNVEVLEDLAAVSERNLATLARIVEASRKFEGGDEVLSEAARAYREGFITLIATPAHLFPIDGEARRDSMQVPSDGSTSSPPMLANGQPGGSSPKALGVTPTQADPVTTTPEQPDGQGPELLPRLRGRPKGSRNKPKPRQSTTKDQDGRKA